MKKTDFRDLLESIAEARKIKAGKLAAGRVFKFDPLFVRNIREKLNISQSEFAYMIGVKLSTLQNWEQGRRQPEGPAKALLKVASTHPEAVLEALHS